MNRQEALELVNSSDIGSHLNSLQKLLFMTVANSLTKSLNLEDSRRTQDSVILNRAGPVLAAEAVEYATKKCLEKGYFQKIKPNLNGSAVHNVKMIQNWDGDTGEYDDWSDSMRRFLLPRSSYYNFDSMVDPRHQIDRDCGHPPYITPFMYRWMYDRDDATGKVIDIYSDECWANDPDVYETEAEDDWTDFELDWKDLVDNHNILQSLYRADKSSGIGHFGLLILGIGNEEDLSKPLPGVENYDPSNPVGRAKVELKWVRPVDEYLVQATEFEKRKSSRRFDMPNYYNVLFENVGLDLAPRTNSSVSTYERVHWTRAIHIADGLMSSPWAAAPRAENVFDRLLDRRKVLGSSGEMYYQGAFPGIAFELDPSVKGFDEIDYDKEGLRKEIRRYTGGFDRFLEIIGLKAHSLAPQVVDPLKHILAQERAIASRKNVPFRIWQGSEEARLASSQDKLTWNKRLMKYIRNFVNPSLIRPTIHRLIACGVIRPPKSGKFYTGWADLNTATDEDKANLALKWSQALSQYVATGMIHLIRPLDFLTIIMGLTPSQAKMIVKNTDMSKLKKVDPSQGAGVNGIRKNPLGKGGDPTKSTDGMKG